MKHIMTAVLLVFAIGMTVRADSDASYYRRYRQQFISHAEAGQIALAAFEATYNMKGRIDEVEFDHERYGDFFEVEIKVGGREYDVYVDARTGRVVRGARDVATAGAGKTTGTGNRNVANSLLAPWLGTVNVAWESTQGWNGLAVTISKNGRGKVSGTLADGTKVSASGRLTVNGSWLQMPVVWAKRGRRLAFTLWLPTGDGEPRADGLGEAIVGKPGLLGSTATFNLLGILGDEKYAEYLPYDVSVSGGARWIVASGAKGKVVYKRGTTVIDTAKLGANPSGLKLTYYPRSGTFKGSFRTYSEMGGRLRSKTVKVAGVLVDGVGFGTATLKGGGSVPVVIE